MAVVACGCGDIETARSFGPSQRAQDPERPDLWSASPVPRGSGRSPLSVPADDAGPSGGAAIDSEERSAIPEGTVRWSIPKTQHLFFSPNGQLVRISGSTVVGLDPRSGEEQYQFEVRGRCYAVTDDGSRLLTINIWNHKRLDNGVAPFPETSGMTGRLQLVRMTSDAFYDAITVRIWASIKDYTVDESNRIVCGDPGKQKQFTEYWTFMRRRGIKESDKEDSNCPNCGAPLKINMAGICEYCDSKVTSGEFDWVLSRIEQDEAYVG